MVNTFTIGPKLKYINLLDNKRLGKQRLEAKAIIDILEYYDENDEMPANTAWTNHPATMMWVGHTNALKVYFNYVLHFWEKRGFKNNYEYYDIEREDVEIIKCIFEDNVATFEKKANKDTFPIWFCFPPFYLAQRAALIMKDRDYYEEKLRTPELKPYFLKGYLWPSEHGKSIYKEWDIKYLAPMGTGIPAEYRLDKKMVKVWVENKNTNPVTGRAITESGAIYKDYKRAATQYGYI